MKSFKDWLQNKIVENTRERTELQFATDGGGNNGKDNGGKNTFINKSDSCSCDCFPCKVIKDCEKCNCKDCDCKGCGCKKSYKNKDDNKIKNNKNKISNNKK